MRRETNLPFIRLEEINPESIQWLKEYGIDLHAGDRIEIAPAVQHFQGGVKIREKANTSSKASMQLGNAQGVNTAPIVRVEMPYWTGRFSEGSQVGRQP